MDAEAEAVLSATLRTCAVTVRDPSAPDARDHVFVVAYVSQVDHVVPPSLEKRICESPAESVAVRAIVALLDVVAAAPPSIVIDRVGNAALTVVVACEAEGTS
jgi:hypothetical protein